MRTKYVTEDGKEFDTIEEAEAHEGSAKSKADEQYYRYLSGYDAKKLLSTFSLNTTGVWEVRGEDPNCDFGGYHHQPHLGTYSGRLEDVIRLAVTLSGFWQWGSGGSIRLVTIKEV